jgi:hypothetical protein
MKEVINLMTTSTAGSFARGITVMFIALAFSLLLIAAAGAAPKEGYSNEGPPSTGKVIPPDRGREPGGSALPFTGADITLLVATGLAAVGTGVYVVRRARTKESA